MRHDGQPIKTLLSTEDVQLRVCVFCVYGVLFFVVVDVVAVLMMLLWMFLCVNALAAVLV